MKLNPVTDHNQESTDKMSSSTVGSGETGLIAKAPEVGKNSLSDLANRASEMTSGEDHSEGRVAKMIEKQTAKLPSDIFLWAGFGSILASATLRLTGKKSASDFVGHWAPTFLILGLYNKLVKVAGSDANESAGARF